MTELNAELRESEDNSMVEAGDAARDSSSGSPRMFWMLNGCIVELELSEAKLLITVIALIYWKWGGAKNQKWARAM